MPCGKHIEDEPCRATDLGKCVPIPKRNPIEGSEPDGISFGVRGKHIAIAQAIRLSSMKSSRTLLQLELATPEMIIDSDEALAPPTFLGGELLELI